MLWIEQAPEETREEDMFIKEQGLVSVCEIRVVDQRVVLSCSWLEATYFFFFFFKVFFDLEVKTVSALL